MDSQQKRLARLLAEQKRLPPVQTLVMRALIRAWRSRYALTVPELRRRVNRNVHWGLLYQLSVKGLIRFNPMGANWGVAMWHGRPIIKVSRDGRVTTTKEQFAAWVAEHDRVDHEAALKAGIA